MKHLLFFWVYHLHFVTVITVWQYIENRLQLLQSVQEVSQVLS